MANTLTVQAPQLHSTVSCSYSVVPVLFRATRITHQCPFWVVSYFRNLKFVFSVLICRFLSLLYLSIRVRTAPPVSVRVRVSVSFSFTVLCLQRWRWIFLMCPSFFASWHSYRLSEPIIVVYKKNIIIIIVMTSSSSLSRRAPFNRCSAKIGIAYPVFSTSSKVALISGTQHKSRPHDNLCPVAINIKQLH